MRKIALGFCIYILALQPCNLFPVVGARYHLAVCLQCKQRSWEEKVSSKCLPDLYPSMDLHSTLNPYFTCLNTVESVGWGNVLLYNFFLGGKLRKLEFFWQTHAKSNFIWSQCAFWRSLRTSLNPGLKWVNIYLAHFQLHILGCNLGRRGNVHYTCLSNISVSTLHRLLPHMVYMITGPHVIYHCFNPCSIHEDVISCKSFDPSCPLLLLHCVFSDLQKNMITAHQSSAYGHNASHRGGHYPWKLNFLIQITFSFLLFCNNSNNEKENEITLRNRWSMTSIHQLGRMLWFPPPFHSGLCMHMDEHTFITNAAQV